VRASRGCVIKEGILCQSRTTICGIHPAGSLFIWNCPLESTQIVRAAGPVLLHSAASPWLRRSQPRHQSLLGRQRDTEEGVVLCANGSRGVEVRGQEVPRNQVSEIECLF